ncbi:MAG: hypothetical protein NVSMB18_21130 [Acetobacteraceae bacterium]
MRSLLIVLLALLSGCAGWTAPTGALLAADAASVVVFGRGIADLGVSAISGRDCSIVRLDQGLTYCAPFDAQEPPPVFCTRSLGVVDCWADPAMAPPPRQGVADTPPPSPDQLHYRAARWPKSLNASF